jgi:hypothetical protein
MNSIFIYLSIFLYSSPSLRLFSSLPYLSRPVPHPPSFKVVGQKTKAPSIRRRGERKLEKEKLTINLEIKNATFTTPTQQHRDNGGRREDTRRRLRLCLCLS